MTKNEYGDVTSPVSTQTVDGAIHTYIRGDNFLMLDKVSRINDGEKGFEIILYRAKVDRYGEYSFQWRKKVLQWRRG